MQNHKKIIIDYNPDDIINVLPKYSHWTDEGVAASCSKEEIRKISNILDLNLPITSILYFRLGKTFKGYIHIDKNLNNPEPSLKHALNFPLYNCHGVYMQWYKQIDPNKNEKPFGGPSAGTPTACLGYDNAESIDEVNCNQVNLVNVADWHAIENRSSDEYCYLISVRFKPYCKTSFDKPMHEWLE